jgi:putative transposase
VHLCPRELSMSESRIPSRSEPRTPPKRPWAATPAKAKARLARTRGPLVAKRPGHLWFIDFTRVGGVLRSVVVGAVIDGFSRKLLAIAVAPREPTAALAVRLLREAVRDHGAPTWVITDHGKQFTSVAFTRALKRHSTGRRYGAVGRSGSIALIERFWRSFKFEYANGLLVWRPIRSIDARLRSYASWFNEHRPHQGLGGRTPDEVHDAKSTRAKSVPLRAAIEVRLLDDDRDLPVLRLRKVAWTRSLHRPSAADRSPGATNRAEAPFPRPRID